MKELCVGDLFWRCWKHELRLCSLLTNWLFDQIYVPTTYQISPLPWREKCMCVYVCVCVLGGGALKVIP